MKSFLLALVAMPWFVPLSIAGAASPENALATPTDVQTGDVARHASPSDAVLIEIHEGVPKKQSWDFDLPAVSTQFKQPTFAIVGYPKKYSSTGVISDRSNPFLLRARAKCTTPSSEAGEYEVVLRSRGAARLFIDDQLVLETDFLESNADGHEEVPQLSVRERDDLRPLPPGCQEKSGKIEIAVGEHVFRLEAIVGGSGLRLELNELCVAWSRCGKPLELLSADPAVGIPVTDEAWQIHVVQLNESLRELDAHNRRNAARPWAAYWQRRHQIARDVVATLPAIEIPDVPRDWPVHNAVDRFLAAPMIAAGVRPRPLADDHAFLRRVTLDTVGVVPTRKEIAAYLQDGPYDRRALSIDRLLDDPRWADHWVSYWQDVLAENPGILKPELNNTGPFRWWIYESLVDNKPLDRFVTELVMMEGSKHYGGPAGFAMATQNDAPLAAKAHVLAQAFLGVEMKCARCHDAPYHPYKQQQLFNMAAMLGRKPLVLPETSTVPANPGGRQPAVEVSLAPGQEIAPRWPFSELSPDELPEGMVENPDDSRELLAAMLTSPHNRRFSQVVVNRLWARLMGRGLVEPVDDWEIDTDVPEVLDYLARELAEHDYDLKHVARLILNSRAYQARISAAGAEESPELFASPSRRRLTAEQLVDSLYVVSGKAMDSEWLTLDPEGRRPVESFLNLGLPDRAWQFTSLSNERDRPALALPVAQSIIDLLLSYGWRDARPNPVTARDETPTLLQPPSLANGIVGRRAVRLSDDSALAELCLESRPLTELLDEVSLQILSRPASSEEREMYVALLCDGYESRIVPGAEMRLAGKRSARNAVSWSNHLSAEATEIKLELERAVQAGDPPTARLDTDWRERMEDAVWAMINSPEFMFVP